MVRVLLTIDAIAVVVETEDGRWWERTWQGRERLIPFASRACPHWRDRLLFEHGWEPVFGADGREAPELPPGQFFPQLEYPAFPNGTRRYVLRAEIRAEPGPPRA